MKRKANQSRTRFRPFKKNDPRRNQGTIGGRFGQGLTGPKQDAINAALDEMSLRHAIETAEALTDEEQSHLADIEDAQSELDNI